MASVLLMPNWNNGFYETKQTGLIGELQKYLT